MSTGEHRLGVRARIVSALLAGAALAMAVSGGAWVVIQRRDALEQADEAIARDVRELRRAASGQGSTAPQSVEQVLRLAIAAQSPAADQTYLGLIDPGLILRPSGQRPLALESEPAIRQIAARTGQQDPVTVRSAQTSAGAVRFAVIPVQAGSGPGADSGQYIVAVLMKPHEEAIWRGARQYAGLGALSLVLVGMTGWALAGRLLLPLTLLREAAERTSDTDLTARIPVVGRDDISGLTRTVNAMLERLEGSFSTQRQFLDDAGHELRTPLTIIRGHLELLDVNDPVEVEQTQALVLDELNRMARLVNDLSVLAKSIRPDFVRREVTDLQGWAQDLVERARALGPQTWSVGESATGQALVDRDRLTQAVLALADNAARYTPAQARVELSVIRQGAMLELRVRDDGPGVAPGDAERIFGRFTRGERPPSGAADEMTEGAEGGEGGSGLGLAIVEAIAQAHGGRAELTPSPAGGATFSIWVPAEGRE